MARLINIAEGNNNDFDCESFNIYTEESEIDVMQELDSYLKENIRTRFCTDPSWMN